MAIWKTYLLIVSPTEIHRQDFPFPNKNSLVAVLLSTKIHTILWKKALICQT